jgi:hypothetical protein
MSSALVGDELDFDLTALCAVLIVFVVVCIGARA